MAGEPETSVIACDFPRNDEFSQPPIPMLIARRTGKSTVFASLLQAERGELPESQISWCDDRHGLLRVPVQSQGSVRDFSMKRLQ